MGHTQNMLLLSSPRELLHALRDEVTIMYADHSKREQDSIVVEVFNNMDDADTVQWLHSGKSLEA